MFASDGRVQGDVEEGTTPLLYPGTGNEENELLWSFVRKIYYILASQAILTTVVSAITVFCTPINNLLHGMNTFLLILLILLPLLLLIPMYIYRDRHLFAFFGLFTLSLNIAVGLTSANTNGKIVLIALILTSAVFLARIGCIQVFGSNLLSSLFVLVLTGFFQLFFPLGSIATAIYCAISVIAFCAYILRLLRPRIN